MLRATSPPGRSSRHIQSASSTLISPECGWGQGKPYLYVGIDRASKFAFVELVDKANTATARTFLGALVAAVPYKIKIVLTDNGIQFGDLPKNRSKTNSPANDGQSHLKDSSSIQSIKCRN